MSEKYPISEVADAGFTVEKLRAIAPNLLENAVYGNEDLVLESAQELLEFAEMAGFIHKLRQIEVEGSVPRLLLVLEDPENTLEKGLTKDVKFGRVWHFNTRAKGAPGEIIEFDFDPRDTEGFEDLVAFVGADSIEKTLDNKWDFHLSNS